MAQQQADALALLAESALHHGIDPGFAIDVLHPPALPPPSTEDRSGL